MTAPANGQGGWIRGVEVSGAFEFGQVSRDISTASARRAASPTPITSSTRRRPTAVGGVLPGFSKWVYDVTGYYEKNGFQARASYRHRSAFKGEVVALFSNLGLPADPAGCPARCADRLHLPAGFEVEWARHRAAGQQRAEFALSDLSIDRSERHERRSRPLKNTVVRGSSARATTSSGLGRYEMTAFAGRLAAGSDHCALRRGARIASRGRCRNLAKRRASQLSRTPRSKRASARSSPA